MNKVSYYELEWIRASASMPLASKIVKINDRKFLDGGISDSIPLKFMESMGYDKNIVILTQPRDFVKHQSRSISMIKKIYRKYPAFIKSFEKRPEMYNNELNFIRKSEKYGRAFVIAPPEKLPIGHIEHNSEKLLEVYRIGRKTALSMLDDINDFLNRDSL